MTLARLIGVDTLKNDELMRIQRQVNLESKKLKESLWNYLAPENQQQSEATQVPRQSFEEILKQQKELGLKMPKRRSYEDRTVSSNFVTQRAWGMAPEEELPTDFE